MGSFQLTGGSSGNGRDNPFLSRLRALATLEDPELVALSRLLGEPRQVRVRSEIVRDEEQTDQLHVIMEGWAARVHLLPDGRRQLTRLLLPGDVADLDTLYLKTGGAGITTLTTCVISPLKRKAVRDLASQEATVADAFGRLAAVEHRMLAERNACLGRRSAREHLAHLLCELAIRLNVIGQGSERGFTLPITQEDIADVLGLTSVHVNRTLQSLRTDRVIEQSGHVVTIRDWPALQQEAGFRVGYLRFDDQSRPDGRSSLRPALLPQPLGL